MSEPPNPQLRPRPQRVHAERLVPLRVPALAVTLADLGLAPA